MPKSKGPPKLDIWLSPLEPKSYEFMLKLKPYYQSWMYKVVQLNPILRFKSQRAMNQKYLFDKNFFTKNCYSLGSFCVETEKGVINKPLELLDEGIRQMCLWEQSSDDKKDKWFKYIENWKDQCLADLNTKEV